MLNKFDESNFKSLSNIITHLYERGCLFSKLSIWNRKLQTLLRIKTPLMSYNHHSPAD